MSWIELDQDYLPANSGRKAIRCRGREGRSVVHGRLKVAPETRDDLPESRDDTGKSRDDSRESPEDWYGSRDDLRVRLGSVCKS